MKEITDSNFTVPTNGVVLIDFWAKWCAPCRAIGLILDEISKEMPDVQFFKIDVDEQRDLLEKMELNITALPTTIVYRNGKKHTSMTGLFMKKYIIEVLNKAAESQS